jgi:type IV secretory pathway VirD2 relaxase
VCGAAAPNRQESLVSSHTVNRIQHERYIVEVQIDSRTRFIAQLPQVEEHIRKHIDIRNEHHVDHRRLWSDWRFPFLEFLGGRGWQFATNTDCQVLYSRFGNHRTLPIAA